MTYLDLSSWWFAIHFTVKKKIGVEKDWGTASDFALGMLSRRGSWDISVDMLNKQLAYKHSIRGCGVEFVTINIVGDRYVLPYIDICTIML